MIIVRSDLTEQAIDIGMWNTLCEMAGVSPDEDFGLPSDKDEIEFDIIKVKVRKYTSAN